jgi:hypothetical protein
MKLTPNLRACRLVAAVLERPYQCDASPDDAAPGPRSPASTSTIAWRQWGIAPNGAVGREKFYIRVRF